MMQNTTGKPLTIIQRLPDGTEISLTSDQNAALTFLHRNRGLDVQQMLLNFHKYGKFEPTKEDFAAYRARLGAMLTSSMMGDTNTGFAGFATADVFNMLYTAMNDHLPVSAIGNALKLLEELRRRLAAAPSQLEQILSKAQEDLREVSKQRDLMAEEAREACDARDRARREEEGHRERAIADQKLIASLEHRVHHLLGLLPEEVKANGRALQL